MGKKKPLISVVIPSYNSQHYLPDTISSVFAQEGAGRFFELEVIVVDDGSTDDTESVVKKYGNKVVYRKTINSGRPAVPRNIGASISEGEYLAFLDADDIWLPTKINEQLGIFARDSEVALVSSNAQKIDEKGRKKGGLVVAERLLPSESDYNELLKNNFICTSATVVRKNVFERVGGFDEESNLKTVEDYELWLRMAANGKISYQASPTILYRVHGDNISKANERLAAKRMALVYKSVASKLGISQKKAALKMLSNTYYSISKMGGTINGTSYRLAAKITSLRARLIYN